MSITDELLQRASGLQPMNASRGAAFQAAAKPSTARGALLVACTK